MMGSMDNLKPTKRRWFRFSLRTMLVVMLVFGSLMGWVVRERRESHLQRALAMELRAKGWNAEFIGRYHTFEYAADDQGWWRKLATQVLGEQVDFVDVSCRSVTLDDLKPLLLFKDATNLNLSPSSLRNLGELPKFTHLVSLNITGTRVTDLQPVSGLKQLKYLKIGATQIRDTAPILGLQNLVELDVTETPITQEQIDSLQRALPHCLITHNRFSKVSGNWSALTLPPRPPLTEAEQQAVQDFFPEEEVR
jgi:hypothetical protein